MQGCPQRQFLDFETQEQVRVLHSADQVPKEEIIAVPLRQCKTVTRQKCFTVEVPVTTQVHNSPGGEEEGSGRGRSARRCRARSASRCPGSSQPSRRSRSAPFYRTSSARPCRNKSATKADFKRTSFIFISQLDTCSLIKRIIKISLFYIK
jgi:hypothetical protein